MARFTDLSSAYSRTRIVVWVEDDLTKQYLTEVWNDNDVSFLIAGSNEAVHAVVGDADLLHVFGIVDRDFGRTNYDSWMNPDCSFNMCFSQTMVQTAVHLPNETSRLCAASQRFKYGI